MRISAVIFICILCASLAVAQGTNATITGRVVDPSSAVITSATVDVISLETGTHVTSHTNNEGIYTVTGLLPNTYRIEVSKPGFKTVLKPDVLLHVQDVVAVNFTLPLGAASETITVSAGAPLVNASDASVSTVIDQTYVQNMPLNGRSFQDLILLTPGVVTQSSQPVAGATVGGNGQTGEFAVNGQRTEENYYTVDGVSANVGSSSDAQRDLLGSGISGSVAASTALGTTQALVSVDDLQEFRVQSSTYSAEYGRNPGGQFAFQTKSGTNQWHGSAYDYIRNGFFDSIDWFNDFDGIKEPPLRQNDFGGTVGGAILKDKTFFFSSYEGLRLVAPQPATTVFVPDTALRALAPPALRQALNAWPIQNGPDDAPNFMAQFISSWSNPSSLDSVSIRLDHSVTDKLRLFFRFADTMSSSTTRFSGQASPSNSDISDFTLHSYTLGATALITNRFSNDFRLNYTSNNTAGHTVLDSFGGAIPVDITQLAGLASGSASTVAVLIGPYTTQLFQGEQSSAQRQWNVVDTMNYSVGRHQLKFGVDYRRLTPFSLQSNPLMTWRYNDVPAVQNNQATLNAADTFGPAHPLYQNFSAFAQDEWKLLRRMTLSLGLRWEVNPAPGVTQGLMPFTLLGSDPSNWTLAPQGTPLWKTTWYNFAPRLGIAYLIHDNSGWETVLRAGSGIFFDTGQQAGSAGFVGPGFLTSNFQSGLPFPQPVPANPIPANPSIADCGCASGAYPHLQLPYTIQWNASVQQSLGKSQALTVSYVASHASRLLRTDFEFDLNTGNQFNFVENALTSDYHSLQTQFQRSFSHGLTALASYTWSHCNDYGSTNIVFGTFVRGNCDFDVRHNFSAAFSYDLPNVGQNGFAKAILNHWGLDNRFTARTAFPVGLAGGESILPNGQIFNTGLDFDPTQPLYITQCVNPRAPNTHIPCPGGKGINSAAFSDPGINPITGFPNAGNAPRNFVRGLGAWQMDMAVRREFPVFERLKLQFRAEAFNVFNHPNFAQFNTQGGDVRFGEATATLANSLGTLNPLYQMGGPRSMQFALKFIF